MRLPQTRKRAWAVVVHRATFGLTMESARELLSEIFGVVASLQVDAFGLEEFIVSRIS